MGGKKLKVCQVCAVDFTLDKFLKPLVKGMEARGWNVVSVCSNGPRVEAIKAEGFVLKNIEIARSFNPVRAILSTYHLYKFFSEMHFDVVHVHTPVASIVGRLAAFFAKVPLVVYTAHGFYFHENMSRPAFYFHVGIEKMLGFITDILFTQSLEDHKDAIRFGFKVSDNCHVIGNGVDHFKFNPGTYSSRNYMRDALGIKPNDFVVGFVGRRVEEKGVNELMEALTQVYQVRPNLCCLMIGGRLQSDHSANVEPSITAAKQALGQNFIDLGFREDTHELYCAMDLFCLPSWREGLPRTIIEAMMSAKPVLATNIRGAREQVLDGQTGYLVPIKSPELLADRMVKLIGDRRLGRRMGKYGFRIASEKFIEEKVIAKQINIIENFKVMKK